MKKWMNQPFFWNFKKKRLTNFKKGWTILFLACWQVIRRIKARWKFAPVQYFILGLFWSICFSSNTHCTGKFEWVEKVKFKIMENIIQSISYNINPINPILWILTTCKERCLVLAHWFALFTDLWLSLKKSSNMQTFFYNNSEKSPFQYWFSDMQVLKTFTSWELA